ncbi:hypothetical protein NDU88_001858 [Pleurodeles waltl]|uniref:Uncharacterized protein n=1 Tax=Pleurodeles waltl TaxID=8319 RepID=A0AAV7TJJ5_PLEWA|nr:hypothetical protein NDU88_001858 [Pleurodeles waltl]
MKDEEGASLFDRPLPQFPWGSSDRLLPGSFYDFWVTGDRVNDDGEGGRQKERDKIATGGAPQEDRGEETRTSPKATEVRRGGPVGMKKCEG